MGRVASVGPDGEVAAKVRPFNRDDSRGGDARGGRGSGGSYAFATVHQCVEG